MAEDPPSAADVVKDEVMADAAAAHTARPAPTRTWRVLACVSQPATTGEQPPLFSTAATLADLFKAKAACLEQVEVLQDPTLSGFKEAVDRVKPNMVYCCGPLSFATNKNNGSIGAFHFSGEAPSEDGLLAALQEAGADTVYLDASVSGRFGPALQLKGAPNVVVWPDSEPIPGLAAAQFGATFLTLLLGSQASVPEAFAGASHCVQAHGTVLTDGTYRAPALPALVSATKPRLPDSSSISMPSVPGVDLPAGGLSSFPGWSDVRLLAPRAELRMLICGGSSLIDPARLSFLGEALRALLVLEARALQVLSLEPLAKVPANLPAGCLAVKCLFVTTSGAAGAVVLGAPESVLAHKLLVQHALRMTLVADSVSLQFRLPPAGIAPPTARSSAVIAGGTPVVDCLVLTSVWAVEVMREMCKDPNSHALSALGVAAVGNTADTSFAPGDVQRLKAVVAGIGPAAAPGEADAPVAAGSAGLLQPVSGGDALPDLHTAAAHGNAFFGAGTFMGYAINGVLHQLAPGAPDDDDDGEGVPGVSSGGPAPSTSTNPGGGGSEPGAPGSAGERKPKARKAWLGEGEIPEHIKNFSGNLPGYVCKRPPIGSCSESQFFDDLVDFLTLLRGKPIDRARFPDAVLNGVALDLFTLYKEVVSRGGFRVGNGINWKGQVFVRMRNWTENNKQTGVGNALKRHYQNFLWEYEMAHPQDVTLDRCVLCNGGDAVSSDWLCCDGCENWVHFSCDKRPLGSFQDYSRGKVYLCPTCAKDAPAGAPAPAAAPVPVPAAAVPAPAAPVTAAAPAAAPAPAPLPPAPAAVADGAAGEEQQDAKRQRVE